MSSLDELIRLETANSGIAFRERAYGAIERQGLLRDLIGMANASVGGPRIIFMGVRDVVGGDREFVGVSDDSVAEIRDLCRSLVGRFIEPLLSVRVQKIAVDGVSIAALILEQCDDPPYLLKANVSNTMRSGNGWARKGTAFVRLTRTDLHRMFEAKFLGSSATADVQVGFPGKVPQSEVSLPVLALNEIPSEVAGERIHRMLEAKDASREAFGRTETRIERLLHTKLFGGDKPYEAHSSTSLVKRLENSAQEHLAADRHYEFEVRTHKLNLSLVNVGAAPLERASLVMDFPRLEGVGITDSICQDPGSGSRQLEGYPLVDAGSRTIRVQASVSQIPCGATVKAFDQPLRLWLREPAGGKTLPVDYSLHGKGLREPITGTLRIHVTDAASVAGRPMVGRGVERGVERGAESKKPPVTQKVSNG